MSSAKRRRKNRETAKWLKNQQVCTECGERGLHYVSIPMNLEQIIGGLPPVGFWTCAKFYGPDGRRII